MKDILLYTVIPNLPSRLSPLLEMAKNVWFSWNLPVIDLFRSIDQNLWEETGHNPLAMLGQLEPGARPGALPRRRFPLGNGPHLRRVHPLPGRPPQVRFRPGDPHRFHRGLLLRRIRPDRLPAHLLGRVGSPGRRFPEIRQRSTFPGRGSRAALPERAISVST